MSGAPASDVFVLAVGVAVIAAIGAASYLLRRPESPRDLGVGSRRAGATGAVVDGAIALIVAAVVGMAWLIVTLDFSMD